MELLLYVTTVDAAGKTILIERPPEQPFVALTALDFRLFFNNSNNVVKSLSVSRSAALNFTASMLTSGAITVPMPGGLPGDGSPPTVYQQLTSVGFTSSEALSSFVSSFQ